MERSIYKYILSHTARNQIFLIILTVLSMPFVYISLEIPKKIINEAIGGQNIPDAIFGWEMDQITYLLVLSLAFLLVVILNGGFKYYINVYKGVLGERMLRRFRFDLYSRVLRFPLPHFKRTSQGEIIPMIVAEAEPLGGFIGDAIALPAFQGGLLITYLFFIFQQDALLGLAAIALYPPQMWLIPKLQKKVNELAKRRVRSARALSERIGEGVSGVTDIHAHDTSRYEKADISARLGLIFDIRFELYRRKFFIKFLNNFLAQLTPFFFYSIGGYYVITGQLSIGALVAVLAAYKDISPPWKELLKYYQTLEDIRVKYTQIIDQFQPANMIPPKLLAAPESVPSLTGTMTGSGVSYKEDDGVAVVDGATFRIDLDSHFGVLGMSGSGKDELSRLASRLLFTTSGRIAVGDLNLADLPEPVTGRRIAYVGPDAFVFNGSLEDNLLYGIKHEPVLERPAGDSEHGRWQKELKEAQLTGNSEDDFEADWLDYEGAAAQDQKSLMAQVETVIDDVGLSDDVFEMGMNATLGTDMDGDFPGRVVEARHRFFKELQARDMDGLVEFFNEEAYNANLTVAENILFGAPTDPAFSVANLPENEVVREVLEESGLYGEFVKIGRRVAQLMTEIFADVPPDSELFEQFSLISADDLATFKVLLQRVAEDATEVSEEDRKLLLSLPFKLIPQRHRLGVVDKEMQTRLLQARKALRGRLGEDNEYVQFLDEKSFNPALTVRSNILFGALAYGQAHAQADVASLVAEIVDELDMRHAISRLGLSFAVGTAGARLSLAQRQRVVIARALLKRPDLLIVNEAANALDPNSQRILVDRVKERMKGLGILWVLERPDLAEKFEQVMVLEGGRVVEQGRFDELASAESKLSVILTG